MSTPNPTAPKSRRFLIGLARPLWIVLAVVVLMIGGAVVLQKWETSQFDASNRERFRTTLGRLRRGETSFVLLFCTRDIG
jgi:hypothetical protein